VELWAFFSVIRAHARLVVASALIAALVALAASAVLPASYVASTQILVGPALSTSDRDPTQLQAASSMAQTYAIALQTRATAQAVIVQLGLHITTQRLHSEYSVGVSPNAPVITISASAGTAELAAAIAGALAQQLVAQTAPAAKADADLTATLTAQIASVEALIATARASIAQLSAIPARNAAEQAELVQQGQQEIQLQATLAQLLTTSVGTSYNTVTVIDPATPPADKASPQPILYTGLALVLGALGGLAIAFTLAARDREAPQAPRDTQSTG
jgi:capsular polysaccharide biosynthesis protein